MNMKEYFEKLPDITFKKIFWTLLDIEDKFHVSPNYKIKLPLHSNCAEEDFFNRNAKSNRLDALRFLKGHEILDDYEGAPVKCSMLPGDLNSNYYYRNDEAEILLNLENFESAKRMMVEIYERTYLRVRDDRDQKIYQLSAGDKRICWGVALREADFLFCEIETGKFKKKASIKEPAAKLISYLWRCKERRARLIDMKSHMKYDTTNQVLNLKKFINKFCVGNSLPEIIESFGDGVWGLVDPTTSAD